MKTISLLLLLCLAGCASAGSTSQSSVSEQPDVMPFTGIYENAAHTKSFTLGKNTVEVKETCTAEFGGFTIVKDDDLTDAILFYDRQDVGCDLDFTQFGGYDSSLVELEYANQTAAGCMYGVITSHDSAEEFCPKGVFL